MNARDRRSLAALLAVALSGAASCYGPQIGDGTLFCTDGGICPRGFSCSDRRCWRAPDASHADGTGTYRGTGGDSPAVGGSGGPVAGRGGGGAVGHGGAGAGGSSAGAGGVGGGGASGNGGGTAGQGGVATAGQGGSAQARGGAGGSGTGGGSGGSAPIDAGTGAPLGTKCTAAAACSSGFCVDGFCCEGTCGGTCEACDVMPGHCAAVTSGPPHGTRSPCAGGSDTCAGSCSSASQATCTYPANSSACRPQSCSGNTLTPAAFCDGAGTCGTPATSTCAGNLACNAGGTACLTSCQQDTDCVSPQPYCQAQACTAARPTGLGCSSDGQCQSGHCNDAFCCDLACTDQCEACDVSGHLGTCWPIPSGDTPHGQRGACAGSGVCGGSCNGSATGCVYPGQETTCPCPVLSGTCNGSGDCTMVGAVTTICL